MTIDLIDLSDVLNNFGATYSSPFEASIGSQTAPGTSLHLATAQQMLASGQGAIGVPEPASLGMLLLAAPLLLKRRRANA